METYRVARDEWVETVLRDVIGWSESLEWGEASTISASSPNREVTVIARGILTGADGVGAVVHLVDPTDSLRETPSDHWAATPIDRIEAMLRENGIRIGVVTDGRWWGIVHAAEGVMGASGVVDSLTWIEEPRTRDAFFTLLDRQRIIGGDPADRLDVLFAESIAAAEEITEALGSQVRQAVELLVQSFSESAAEAARRGAGDPLPDRSHDIYEGAVTVMMRIVFLLFAEERGLLPTGELFEGGYGISGELDRLIAKSAVGEELLDMSALTWHRMLATSRALFLGASFENLRMPAYGGSLFDPARFPFLTATDEHGSLKVSVNDRVMLHVLRSVQIANLRGEARRISFRDIDVEQIGYIYEGLLGYTCVRVDELTLGLIGKVGVEPEIPVSTLEDLAATNSTPKALADAVLAWAKEDQPSAQGVSAAALKKALSAEVDASRLSALSQVVGGDQSLVDRISPWLGAVRSDLRGHPYVVRAGGLLVAETPSRKNAGAHYTPKSLAEEVVLHALQPLCYSPGPHQSNDDSTWKLRSSDDILGLKIADIACGSGAFLVAAARYLADRVVEAWITEDTANIGRRDLHTKALRQVVANCLYGADINDMAVEMCKLSLWLVSLDRDLPFSFVDDKIFLGNSLLGLTSLDQLRALHIDPSQVPTQNRLDIPDVDVDAIIAKAVEFRERLATEIDETDPARTSAAKRRQLAEFHRVTDDLRRIADGVIAAGLPLGGKPGAALDDAYANLRIAVARAFPGDGKEASPDWLDGLIDRGLTPTVSTDYERWQPLHWVLEVPDVIVDHGGFDAVIGNPPFLGFKKISPAIGKNMRDFIVKVSDAHSPGKADLVAYFLLRAWVLRSADGVVGFVTTNTIAEGDTRESSIEQLMEEGMVLFRATRSTPWPVSTVNLSISAIHFGMGPLNSGVKPIVDGEQCTRISPLLEPAGRVSGVPRPLPENSGLGFQGSIPLGDGLIISPMEASEWIQHDPRNSEVLLPYISGDDVNTRPELDPSRWVIDFGSRNKSEAKSFGLPFAHAEKYSKPARANEQIQKRRDEWWLFAQWGGGWRRAVEAADSMIVMTIVSKPVMPVRIPVGPVCSNALEVFTRSDDPFFGVLSSAFHQLWAITYGSTLGSTLRYTISDVLETFPFPQDSTDVGEVVAELERVRGALMRKRSIGLTSMYNLVNDRDLGHGDIEIAELRGLHIALDNAVAASFGWSDIDLNHEVSSYRGLDRFSVCPDARTEILDRLLEENHRRAALEADATGTKKSQKKKAKAATNEMEALF